MGKVYLFGTNAQAKGNQAEERAFRVAGNAVERDYEKGEDGEWQRKVR